MARALRCHRNTVSNVRRCVTAGLQTAQAPSLPPVDDGQTEAEATAKCVARGVIDDPLTSVNELAQCIAKLMG